jgi:hypothetical protein
MESKGNISRIVIRRSELGVGARNLFRYLTPIGNKRGWTLVVGSLGLFIGRVSIGFKHGWIISMVLEGI